MTANAELDQWQPAGHAVRIEYSRAVMEQLRLAVTEGFTRISHGGVEVGGVLFGIRDQDTIRILAHRELICEYAFGPSFTLSDEDRKALTELLHAPDTDVGLRSMQPVGWYHSHTRSEIQLTEKDLALYDQYFPESWQIALVLRPHRFDPMRAGFFFREPDGSVNADATREEFLILPVSRKPGPVSAPEEQYAPATPDASAPESDQAREAPQVPLVPTAVDASPPAKRRIRWAWIAAASIVLLAAGLYVAGKPGRRTDISLRAVDIGSAQLRVNWDRGAPAIQRSAGGELEIEDGGVKTRGALTREFLLTGHVTYQRTSGQVMVRLTLRDARGGTVTEMASFTGAPVPGAVVPAAVATAPALPAAPLEKVREREEKAPPPQREQEAYRTAQLPKRAPTAEAEQADEGAAPAPERLRRWVEPTAAVVSAPTELPSPPAIAVNTPAPIANIIPRAPVHIAPKPPDPWPASGKLIWTGKLARGGTIQITGNHASLGRLAGSLPGIPVRVHVFPTELTQNGLRVFTGDALSVGLPEAPGAQNGWMQTTWVLNAKKADDLRIIEAPSQDNGWNRLSVRAERGDHTVIVFNWDRILSGQ